MLAMEDIEESSSSSSNSNAPGLFKLFGKTITVEDQKDKPSNSNNNEETSKEGIAAGGALLCPRCKSKDTKFCYFNNYNVNQPRHFCRSCHRYWTAGGTLRNVPKGAGRRKTRSSPGATSPVKLSLLHES